MNSPRPYLLSPRPQHLPGSQHHAPSHLLRLFPPGIPNCTVRDLRRPSMAEKRSICWDCFLREYVSVPCTTRASLITLNVQAGETIAIDEVSNPIGACIKARHPGFDVLGRIVRGQVTIPDLHRDGNDSLLCRNETTPFSKDMKHL